MKKTVYRGNSLIENAKLCGVSEKKNLMKNIEASVAKIPGPNPPIQPLSTIEQKKSGVWKVGAGNDSRNLLMQMNAEKTSSNATPYRIAGAA